MKLNVFLFVVFLLAFAFEGWVLAVVATVVAVVCFFVLCNLFVRLIVWLFSERDVLDVFWPSRDRE